MDVTSSDASNPRAAGLDATSATLRPRLLFLCQTLPYPPSGGVLIRTYNILRLLARDFDITALCFFRANSHATYGEVRSAANALQKLAHVEAFPIPQEHSMPRYFTDHLRSLIARRPYTVYAYESAEFRETLRQHLRSARFEVVHLDSLDLATYFPLLRHLPVVCVHHNVESDLLRRRARTMGSLSRAYVDFQASLVEREECELCPQMSLNIAVSQPDKDTFLRLVPHARFAVVPNGVDTESFRPGTRDGAGIVFVGSHSWHPNRDAMEYFCSCVLPLLRAGGVKDRVTWVGRATPKVIREYADHYDVKLTGFVDDIRPIVQQAACYIAPLRSGGGTRLKILDAWAMGKAVVSTAVGCEGLDARDGENILIGNNAEEFAAAVALVLKDSDLRVRLGNAARETAVALYDWELIGDRMIKEYLGLLADREPSHHERVAPKSHRAI